MKIEFMRLATSGNTVFSYHDLAYYFGNDRDKLTARIAYYTKKNYLYRIKRWLYSLDQNYSVFEMATKIQKPSYISLQSALRIHGINFQYDETAYVIGYKTEEVTVDGKKISFKALKKDIRENFNGIVLEKNYAIASRERAILDTLYLYKYYFFDNLEWVNWDELERLMPIYDSKILEKRVKTLRDNYLKNEYYSELDREKHRGIMLNILVDIYRDFELGTSLVFKWGTACYFLYWLDRFSTDLDFGLIGDMNEGTIQEKINKIIGKYGTVRTTYNKRYTIFSMLSYGDVDHNIKVEISKRGIRWAYRKINWHSLSILAMDEVSIFTHKLFTLLNRASLTNRDLYDIYYCFRKWVDFDRDLLRQLTGKDYREYFADIIDFLDHLPKSHRILEWLWEVLDQEQKVFVKNRLVYELRWLLEMKIRY